MGTDINGNQIPFSIPQFNGTLVSKQQQQHNQQQQHTQQQQQSTPQQQNQKDSQHQQQQQNEFTYFNVFTRELLIQAIKTILFHNDKPSSSSSSSSFPSSSSLNKPLYSMKLMISLLDRPEIVSPILTDLLLAILRSMHRDCVRKLKESVEQLLEEKVSSGEVMADTLARKVRL